MQLQHMLKDHSNVFNQNRFYSYKETLDLPIWTSMRYLDMAFKFILIVIVDPGINNQRSMMNIW